MNETVSTRSSRNRRVVALMGWGCLVITAFFMSSARQTDSIRAVTDEPVAFILAAFAAFVGVFAWMLYNPGRRTAPEAWSLAFAALATLFPPSIIGFCLMPVESPLRWWLALGLFLLCVVAVLSHVPDEFFGVPRGRSSYLTPIPAFDRVEGTVLDPNASWFTREDLTRVVLDAPRPSLAPRSYLQRPETVRAGVPVRAEVRQVSEVDDILGTNFDLGLLEDEFSFDDQPTRQSALSPARRKPSPLHQEPTQQTTHADHSRGQSRQTGGSVYTNYNPDSGRLRNSQRTRREAARQRTVGYTTDRTSRHASSLRVEPAVGRGSVTDYAAGIAASRIADRPQPSDVAPADDLADRARRGDEAEREARDREVTRQRAEADAQREADRRQREARQREAQLRRETEEREALARQDEARRRAEAEAKAKAEALRETDRRQREAQLRRETEEREARALKETRDSQQTRYGKSRQQSRDADTDSPAARSIAGIGAIPVPFGGVEAPRGFLEEQPPSTRQLFGQTIEKVSSKSRETTDQPQADRSQRRSRYDAEEREGSRTPATPTPTASMRASSLKSQQQAFERTKDEDGSELVEGVMQVHFDQGQKRANVHIPFSPPLPGMPEVDCECVGGEDLRLKVPVRQSYGIRIEARRSNADQPLDAEIGFSAVYTKN